MSMLWAVTTYYNPMNYRRRLINYRAFRNNLQVPLVAVELGYNGHFELQKSDADVLVQVSSGAVLWQKERLLNIATANVPASAKYIAWLDCDVIFDSSDWAERTMVVLQGVPIAQLFEELQDLERDVSFCRQGRRIREPTGRSIAARVASEPTSEFFSPAQSSDVRKHLFGLAWAARREVLGIHGFYDMMILGSGDRAMACAAYGRFDECIKSCHLGSDRASHYLRWALPYYSTVQSRVGFISGTLFHLWHGDIADRRYLERHRRLAEFDFRPDTDVALGPDGCWEWTMAKPALQSYVKEYFLNRKEDG